MTSQALRIAFLALVVGCSGRSVGGPPGSSSAGDAGPLSGAGALNEPDNGAGGLVNGITYDADSGAQPCTSLASYCDSIAQRTTLYTRWPQAPGCVPDWTAAQTAAAWCPDGPDASAYSVWLYPGCRGYNRVVLGGTDTSSSYLYDLTSGELVGIGGLSIGGWACIAGTIPATGVPVGCDNDAGQSPVPICGQ
jgi:hypothetical protein